MSTQAFITPRPLRHCRDCGWFIPHGSRTEELHHTRCDLPRLSAMLEQRHNPRGNPLLPRPRAGIDRRHVDRIAMLRAALVRADMHERLIAITKLPLARLARVAGGRSTLSTTIWRKLSRELSDDISF